MQKNITIKYNEFNSIDELNSVDRNLANKAIEAQKSAYAPYSKYSVGAAVLLDDGNIVKGSNQENAAYPSGLCAERTALFSAGANYPNQKVKSIALVAGPNGEISDIPASPCGACRQVMAEYQSKAGEDVSVIMIGKKRILKFEKVDDILPFVFTSNDLL